MAYSDHRTTTGPGELLNVAAVHPATRAFGPGLRAVVWVQGCEFQCRGCLAPDWIPIRPARLVRPEDLVHELLANSHVTGLTFSGGEPMLQASALARLAILGRSMRALDIICYTGFTRDQLERSALKEPALDLLEQVDVLIDGRYIDSLNDGRGMRGSSNQRVYYLTRRLEHVDFSNCGRKAEVLVHDGQPLVVGVPPLRGGHAYHPPVDRAGRQNVEIAAD